MSSIVEAVRGNGPRRTPPRWSPGAGPGRTASCSPPPSWSPARCAAGRCPTSP
ncbi:hypothetical protein ACFQ0M_11020 [Kitasatospora aburaviensis]